MKWILIAALIHAHPSHAPQPEFCGNSVAVPSSHVFMEVMVPCRDNGGWHHRGWRKHRVVGEWGT